MAIFGLFKREIIYFPGCFSSAFLESKIENYKKILKKIGISFDIPKTKEMLCCGAILEQAGYEKQTRKLAKENASFLEQSSIKKIITSCPLCFNHLKKYKEMLPNFNTEIDFIISTILKSIKENDKLIRNSYYENIVYYDSCILGRYENYIEAPRELLRLFGYNVHEIQNYNREETLCEGSCGNLSITNPELSEEICLNFIKKLLKLKFKKITTADPAAYKHIQDTLRKFNIKDIQLIEISDIICDSLGIKKELEDIQEKNENEEKVKELVGETN